MTLRGTGCQGNPLQKTGYQRNTKAVVVFEGSGAATGPIPGPRAPALALGGCGARLWQVGKQGAREGFVCTLCPAPARRPFFLRCVPCWYSSRILHPRTPCASGPATPCPAPPTGLAAPRGRPSLRCRSSRSSRAPLEPEGLLIVPRTGGV